MQFQTESFSDVRGSIEGLLLDHYREVALHQDDVPLAPDWGLYQHLDESGGLKIFTARQDGGLIGYAIFFVRYHAHYKETLCAINDIVFLRHGYRKGLAGAKLIRYADQELEAYGVDRIFWHIKYSNDFSPILHRMGYLDEEKIVGRLVRH